MIENKHFGIDPEKLGWAIIKKTFKEVDPQSRTSLPVYRVRWGGYTEKWGADSFIIDVLGCNEDCAHCYVPTPLLRADINSFEFEKKFRKLPRLLQEFPQPADKLFEYSLNRFKKKFGSAQGGVIELNGGEPTLYPGAIKRLGELCQREKITLGVNTNGFVIATQDGFLNDLDGLQDTIAFMVSIKGTMPEEFRKFSGASAKHYLTPFIAAKEIQKRGFRPARLGVILDTIAAPETIDKDLKRFFLLLNEFGLDKRMINLDRITEKILGHELPTMNKMIKSGYYDREEGGLIRHTNPLLVEKSIREIISTS